MDEWRLLSNYLIVGGLLFGLGLIGFLVRRNVRPVGEQVRWGRVRGYRSGQA